VRHSSDGTTTPDSPLRPSRRGPRGMSLTPRQFSHRPVYARLRLPTRRRARAAWLVAYSAVTLPLTGPRESLSYDPKTSKGGNVLCTLPRSSRVFVFLPEDEGRRESPVFTSDVGFNILAPCLREPSANGPKVVSPTGKSCRRAEALSSAGHAIPMKFWQAYKEPRGTCAQTL